MCATIFLAKWPILVRIFGVAICDKSCGSTGRSELIGQGNPAFNPQDPTQGRLMLVETLETLDQ